MSIISWFSLLGWVAFILWVARDPGPIFFRDRLVTNNFVSVGLVLLSAVVLVIICLVLGLIGIFFAAPVIDIFAPNWLPF